MKKLCGFTLIEMMVVIVIAAILITVAIPSYQTTIRQNRITTQAAELMDTFSTARIEAVGRSSAVTVCSSANHTSCVGAGGNDWSVGWIIFQDLDANGVFNDDADASLCETNDSGEALEDCLLRTRKALNAGSTLTASNGVSAFNWRLTFNSDAVVNDPATGNNPMTLALDPIVLTLRSSGCGAKEERRIVLNNLGRSNLIIRDCP